VTLGTTTAVSAVPSRPDAGYHILISELTLTPVPLEEGNDRRFDDFAVQYHQISDFSASSTLAGAPKVRFVS
jgi:hypothetical protein